MRKSDIEKAEEKLNELRRVDDSRKFNNRISLEEKGLLNADDRQKGYIVGMFDELEAASNKFLDAISVTILSKALRDMQNEKPIDFEALDIQLRGKEEAPAEPDSATVSTDEPEDADTSQ